MMAHELLHCHFDHILKGVQDYAESKGDGEDSYFAKSHLRDFENIVDTMAVIIAPFLPLPLKYVPSDDEIFGHVIRDAATGKPIYPVPVVSTIHASETGDLLYSAPTNGAVR